MLITFIRFLLARANTIRILFAFNASAASVHWFGIANRCFSLVCIDYRLWTRGYDVYTPNKIAVAHDYYDTMPGVAQNLAQVGAVLVNCVNAVIVVSEVGLISLHNCSTISRFWSTVGAAVWWVFIIVLTRCHLFA